MSNTFIKNAKQKTRVIFHFLTICFPRKNVYFYTFLQEFLSFQALLKIGAIKQ